MEKERKKTDNPREKKERKKTDNPNEGWGRTGGQGPHLHEQDFGRTVRGTGAERKKDNRPAKGGMGGRHAATTQGF